jgi:hypothetical protein
VKTIRGYIALNQTYPSRINGYYCIGESNITNFDADPNVDCGLSSNIKHDTSNTSIFNNGIKTIRASLPKFPGVSVDLNSTTKSAGMLFRGTDVYDPGGENIASYPTLNFSLEGSDQDCVLRPVASSYSGGDFVMSSSKYSYSGTLGTACRIMLLDPTKL